MTHFISYEILTVEMCPYRNLFNDAFIEILKEKESFQHSNIYFICKAKKLRFNHTKTRLNNKTDVCAEIILGNNEKTQTVQSSIYDLLNVFATPFGSKKNFEKLLRAKDPFVTLELEKEQPKVDNISLSLNILNQNKLPIHLLPENFEATCKIDFNNEPQVLYVGQSFRMLDRIQSHKALHKAASQCSDDEDIKVFFINFKYGYGGDKVKAIYQGTMWNYWLNIDRESDEYKTKIDLIERFLIHFFKPIYNDQHTNANMMTDTLVKEILLKESIKSMSVGIGVHGPGYGFWSNQQPLKSELFSFDFRNPQMGYQNGLIMDW